MMTAAEELGGRHEAQYDYAPLVRLLVLTGLRVSEALALRWQDVDLLGATIRVHHSWAREGRLTPPKTKAGVRDVPIAPGLVDMLTLLKPEHAGDEDFVFSTTGRRPVPYHNFRERGFTPALERAGPRRERDHYPRASFGGRLALRGTQPVHAGDGERHGAGRSGRDVEALRTPIRPLRRQRPGPRGASVAHGAST